ncbi:ATP-binding protein [Desulfolithobacter sp.]
MTRKPDTQLRIEELSREVARLKQDNRILREKVNRSDAVSKAKSDFLAMISHEIRTPMNGVIGLTELLLGTGLDDKQRHFARLILTSAQSLMTLINSLLDFSKIEARKMVIESRSFDLRRLVREVSQLYTPTADRKGIRMNTEVDQALARMYVGDPQRIRQVLTNLIGNAVKFTAQGTISLQVQLTSRRDRHDTVLFSVSDTGPGIPGDKIDTIFEPFSQVDASATRHHGGTGLGLAISHDLVSLMGGEIGVDSIPERETTFLFTLPLVRSDASLRREKKADGSVSAPRSGPERPTQPVPTGFRSPRILIVDDDSTNRIVVEEIFKRSGVVPTVVSSGMEAVDRCLKEKFDLIFMDCQMPDMDGFQTAVQIRANAESRGVRCPVIIALTADITEETRRRCQRCGMEGYLAKPFSRRDLQQVLDTWLSPGVIQVALEEGADEKESFQRDSAGKTEVVDQVVIDRLIRNVGKIDRVVNVFVADLENRIQQMEEAIRAGDREGLQRAAHTLKGSCSQFGARQLTRLCLQAEQMGQDGNLGNIWPLIGQIGREAEMVREKLIEFLENR